MTSVARVEPISDPRQFKDYSDRTLLNFNVVDIQTVYFSGDRIPYFEYTFARKMRDSSIGQRLFSVNETSSSPGRIIGDVLSNAFTLDDLGKILNDVNLIYNVFPRRAYGEVLISVRQSINLTLQELIKQKTRQDQLVDYFKILQPDLNFIVKDISVTNVDQNNIPYLSYNIYNQDKLLFQVTEFNEEFPPFSNFLTLLVNISEITIRDLDALRDDIKKIYIRKEFTFDNVVMGMYFQSKEPIRDSILEEIDIIVSNKTALLSDPGSSETQGVNPTSDGTTSSETQGAVLTSTGTTSTGTTSTGTQGEVLTSNGTTSTGTQGETQTSNGTTSNGTQGETQTSNGTTSNGTQGEVLTSTTTTSTGTQGATQTSTGTTSTGTQGATQTSTGTTSTGTQGSTQTSNGTQGTTQTSTIITSNGAIQTSTGTEGSTDISNIENGDTKSSLSSLQILGIVFGSLLLAALVVVLIVLIVNLLRKKIRMK
jgi:hypothetical protein